MKTATRTQAAEKKLQLSKEDLRTLRVASNLRTGRVEPTTLTNNCLSHTIVTGC